MADYSKETALGYKIVAKIQHPHFTHVIVKRDNDYAVGYRYDETDGTWAQGVYGYDNVDDAFNDIIEELA